MMLMVLLAALPGQAQEVVRAPVYVDGATTVMPNEIFQIKATYPEMVIVDTRRAEDYAAGHIKGAVNLPTLQVTKKSLLEMAPKRSVPIVFYCQGPDCRRAALATKVAVDAGYDRIYYYYGGIEDWTLQNLPLATP